MKIMNTPFNYATKELSRTDQQLKLVETIVAKTAEPTSAAVYEVLLESKLAQYYELCQMVNMDPALVQIYARGLQRVEVIQLMLDKQTAELEGSAAHSLGKLALDHEVEKQEIETFFELFAPEHPEYIAYLGSAATSEVVEEPVLIEEAGEEAPAEEPVPEAKPKKTKKAASSQEKEQARTRSVIVDGVSYDLPIVEAFILVESALAQETAETKLKVKMFTDSEVFGLLILAVAGKEISYGATTLRIRNAMDSLVEQFPDIIQRHGTKGGAWFNFNKAYDVRAGEEDDFEAEVEDTQEAPAIVEEITEPELTAPATKAETTTSDQPKTKVAPAQRPRPQESRRSSEKLAKPTPMTSRTKLLEDGFMIDRKLTRYTPEEALAVSIMNTAERKQPYSPARIAEVFRAQNLFLSPEDVDKVMKELSQRLPSGWLIKVETGRDKPKGWRLGSGIRIVKQHGSRN